MLDTAGRPVDRLPGVFLLIVVGVPDLPGSGKNETARASKNHGHSALKMFRFGYK
jgi:hypothetical protein